jgi:hypothetical protein
MRGARRGLVAWIVAALALLSGAGLATTGCGRPSEPTPSASASSAADGYRAVHPTGGLPASLQTVDLSRLEVGRRVASIVTKGVRIVLPVRLPSGFGLAAPYISVGDGTARPNPESWGRSYRVSYTDGQGLIVVTVGAEDSPSGVVWSTERARIGGRRARVGHAGDALIVATTNRRPGIVIAGWRVSRQPFVDTARSMADVR